MRHLQVKFMSVEELVKFVKTVQNFSGDVDVAFGSCVVDGKSIIGMMGMGLAKVLQISIHSSECEQLVGELQFCLC